MSHIYDAAPAGEGKTSKRTLSSKGNDRKRDTDYTVASSNSSSTWTINNVATILAANRSAGPTTGDDLRTRDTKPGTSPARTSSSDRNAHDDKDASKKDDVIERAYDEVSHNWKHSDVRNIEQSPGTLVDTQEDPNNNTPYKNWPSFMRLFKGAKSFAKSTTSKIEMGENDIAIAITGRVGKEGKRFFVDSAVGDDIIRQDTTSLHIHFVVARHPRDSNRSIFFVYTTGSKDQKMNEAIRYLLSWIFDAYNLKRKFSGLIYLEDASTSPPTKLTHTALDLLGQCVESQNIVIATTGWDDSDLHAKHKLEDRHTQLIRQWRPFVDRGVNVLRLAAPDRSSRDVFHNALDIVTVITTKIDGTGSAVKRGVYRGNEEQPGDKFLEDPRDTDIVIPVIGPSGVGKSMFINYVYGHNIAKVGHTLESETADLQPVMLPHPTDRTRRIVLVDTPGFDDSNVEDVETLRRIAVWLSRSYSANMILAGVIYIHEISQTRLLGTVEKNLEMFSKLIGQDATKKVVLLTTKWGQIPEGVGIDREKQLKERHWKDMLDVGAKLFRFEDSHESGQSIIRYVINHAEAQADIEIQKELVEAQKILPDTEAGQALLFSLEDDLEGLRRAVAALRKEGDNDKICSERKEIEQQIQEKIKQIDGLSNPLRFWWRKLLSSVNPKRVVVH